MPGLFERPGHGSGQSAGTVRAGAAGGAPENDPPHPHHRKCARLLQPPAEPLCDPVRPGVL